MIKHSGNTSVSISGNGNWAYWMQHFEKEKIPLGKEVTVSGYIKTEDVKGRAEIEIYCFDSSGKPTTVATAPITGTKDWTFVTASRRIPEDAIRMDICLMIRDSGKVWFDDIQLLMEGDAEEKPEVPITESEKNLLKNSGFEYVLNGQPSFWHKIEQERGWDLYWDKEMKYEGNASVCTTNFNPTDNGAGWAQEISANIPINRELALTGYIKIRDAEKTPGTRIFCYDAKKELIKNRLTANFGGSN